MGIFTSFAEYPNEANLEEVFEQINIVNNVIRNHVSDNVNTKNSNEFKRRRNDDFQQPIKVVKTIILMQVKMLIVLIQIINFIL